MTNPAVGVSIDPSRILEDLRGLDDDHGTKDDSLGRVKRSLFFDDLCFFCLVAFLFLFLIVCCSCFFGLMSFMCNMFSSPALLPPKVESYHPPKAFPCFAPLPENQEFQLMKLLAPAPPAPATAPAAAPAAAAPAAAAPAAAAPAAVESKVTPETPGERAVAAKGGSFDAPVGGKRRGRS